MEILQVAGGQLGGGAVQAVQASLLLVPAAPSRPPGPCLVRAWQLVPGGGAEDGISLDSAALEDTAAGLRFDISHAVRAWGWRPRLNLGLGLASTSGCPPLAASLNITTAQGAARGKRSPGRRRLRRRRRKRKKRDKLCRKKAMKVDLNTLEGFDFIYLPRHFNAGLCSGHCPPRYKPLR